MDPAESNRALNRTMRFLNLAAVALAASELPSRREVLASLSRLIADTTEAQRSLVAQHPDLAYHFDSEPATDRVHEEGSLDCRRSGKCIRMWGTGNRDSEAR